MLKFKQSSLRAGSHARFLTIIYFFPVLQMYVAVLIRSEVDHLRNGIKPVYHIPSPVATPMIPYHALPEFIDPKDMFKY